MIIFIINAFNSIFSCSVQIKCSLLLKNFNIFSLSQNLEDSYVVEIQLYVKCQSLLKFNATRDERLKKSLKYCTFFMDKELRRDFNTSVKNYTHTHTPPKRAAKHNLSSVKKSSHRIYQSSIQ